jgi:ATP-dependent DNA helicase PIF1
MIELPDSLSTMINKDDEKSSMDDFCSEIFPNLDRNVGDEAWLEGRAVLAPTNREVNKINDMMVDKMSGQVIILHSSDGLDNSRDAYRFNVEYINTLNPPGLPSSRLTLKCGMPVMLMRNLNPTEGLCNGTRLVFKHLLSHRLLVCTTVGLETIGMSTSPGSR